MTTNWIAGAIKHKGGLHKALHAPEDKKISHKKIVKAEHSKSEHLRHMAHLADTLAKLRHKK